MPDKVSFGVGLPGELEAEDLREAAQGDVRLIESALDREIDRIAGPGCSPGLARAIRHATTGGGRRVRPRLLLAVCRAVGGELSELSLAAAASLELVHCASLVHDDLPCFDDAPLRRGAPSVHRAYGEALAVLAGDALIVSAFEALGRAGASHPALALQLVAMLGRAAGAPSGITSGQGWESEADPDVERYHAAKTAALFEFATQAGAVAASVDPEPWRELGRRIGMTYQVADDVRDCVGDAGEMGKAPGRDAALERPSAVRSLGIEACRALLAQSVAAAIEVVPECPGKPGLERFVSTVLEEYQR